MDECGNCGSKNIYHSATMDMKDGATHVYTNCKKCDWVMEDVPINIDSFLKDNGYVACDDCIVGLMKYNNHDEYLVKQKEWEHSGENKHHKMHLKFRYCPMCGKKL